MPGRIWLVIAGMLGALAVACGAFHSHGLEPYFARQGLQQEELLERLRIFDVAVRYQIYHALALACIGVLSVTHRSRVLTLAGSALAIGTLLFSGMLYYISISGDHSLGQLAAWGGSTQIVGWILLAIAAPLLQKRDE